MKTLFLMLAAGAFALSGLAGAQTATPDKSGPSTRIPVEPDKGKPPDVSKKKAPSTSGGSGESGVLTAPPATGTEGMVRQPKNVDPEISGATGRVDKKNQEEVESKTGGTAKGTPEYK